VTFLCSVMYADAGHVTEEKEDQKQNSDDIRDVQQRPSSPINLEFSDECEGCEGG
jgi:hypothetical protein